MKNMQRTIGLPTVLSALILVVGIIGCAAAVIHTVRGRTWEMRSVGYSATLQERLDTHAQRNGGQYPSHEALFDFLVKETGFSNGIYNPFIDEQSEPRAGTLPEPGAIFYSVSIGYTSDTLTVIGAQCDTVARFIGTRGKSMERVFKRRTQTVAGAHYRTFPHG
ncbi:MAG: hypothetical protein V1907_01440 [Candidatus Kerfeldbacteria bacterium]